MTAPGGASPTICCSPGPGSGSSCRTTDFPLVFVHADAGDLGAGGNSLCVGDMVEEEILELTDNLT